MVGLQPDNSVLLKVIGRDFTGQAANISVEQARQDGLLNDIAVKLVSIVLSV